MRKFLVSLAMAAVLGIPRETAAYGVLAHEAIVDAAWERSIAPLLQRRYHPNAERLRLARAHAYGGCLIQDLGYYPFSSRTFGDLTHYVRSGDFIASLLGGATDINELAFALGALAHYSADNYGHPLGVNRAVPLLYPKLQRAFGDSVTYEEKPSAHLRTEFAFDVVQVARGGYAPDAYHDFIGFEISRPVLERAFHETYGLTLDDVFGDFDLAVGTFRYAVSTMIPRMTRVAWKTKQDEIYAFPRAQFEKEFGTKYRRPGKLSTILSFVLRIVPKIGPFSALAFRVPTPEAQALFEESFRATLQRYQELIAALNRGTVTVKNLNFDTGRPVRAGEYELADRAYARLLEKLQDTKFAGASAELRAAILDFFQEPLQPSVESKDGKRIRAVLAQLRQ